MKKILAIGLVLVLVLGMVACGGGGEDTDADVPVYKAITEATFPPFDTVDENGNVIGFDMDLITAIGEDQGFKVEFVDMGFDALIPAIESGTGDIITAGMGITEERAEKVDFTDTYYDSALIVVVAADNETINSVDDLTADMKVASQIATTGAGKVESLLADGKIKEAVILDGFDACMLQVINGDVEAVIVDEPVANAYMAKQPGKVKTVGDVMDAESYAFAVQKGNAELLEMINTGLQNVKDNGTYDELVMKWIAGETE
ncbi:MAG: basic amino acid ABC transporter substrate-binding protein [Firmicutes bacterium]|nr:basic amino acid ABC transporter substrate-binding protein [Bacillota bacterium]